MSAGNYYFLWNVDGNGTETSITVPPDCDGVRVLVRRDGKPVHFSLHPAQPGSTVTLKQLTGKSLDEIQTLDRPMLPFEPGPELRPWLSIAICTRDRPQELERCLQALMNLNGGALTDRSLFQVLVIDNASKTRETQEVASRFPTVTYVLEPKPGLSFARNRGVLEAVGHLVAYMDDDAIPDEAWLTGLQQAWMANPEAAGFTGPILPMELVSRAQILLEGRGGFGHHLVPRQWPEIAKQSPVFPAGEACFGGGANMVLQRSILRELGGFDVLLGSGTTTLGGEDLDIFYRAIRAKHSWVFEPYMAIHHQHRREYASLRRQMYTWGVGYMSYLMKSYREDPELRPKLRKVIARNLFRKTVGIFASAVGRRGYPWPVDLAYVEWWGSVRGFFGEYQRSFETLNAAGLLKRLPLTGTKLVPSGL